MKCPHCDKTLRIPEYAERNMETYKNNCNVVTLCCGNMVRAFPVFSFGAYKSDETTDDWGVVVRNPKAKNTKANNH